MKKERLYLYELLEDPAVSYPAWYLLSPRLHRDENLRETLRAIHSTTFTPYHHPETLSELFDAFHSGIYPIYKESYAAGEFGGRVMLLEGKGWKSLPFGEEACKPENWLI
ncbi:hypothetical protein [Nitratifractor sp.]